MKILKLKTLLILLSALCLAACDSGSPTEPAAAFGTDVLKATPLQTSYGIAEGQTVNIQLKLARKTKVQAYINWEVRSGIGRFLQPTGVIPVAADVDSVTIPLETYHNETIEAPTDFEVVLNSDSFEAPVTVIVNVTDLTLPASIQFVGANSLSLPTAAVNTQVTGTITLRNNGEIAARSLTPSSFVSSQIYFLGGSYPGTGGTCSSVLAAGSTCTVVVAASMSAAGSITEDLTFTYSSGISTDTKSIQIRAASDSIIAVLSNLPNSISKDSTLNVTVGGSGIVNYKYKVGDSSLDCSTSSGYLDPMAPSTSSLISVSLSGIPDGNMKLCVVGINSVPSQQQYSAATVYTWFKDTTPPDVQGSAPNYDGTLVINSGALRTKVLDVTLALNTSGSQFMYITNTPGCNSGGVWEIYNDSKAWTLSFANSTNKIYAKFRDSLGNETACVNASITHDNTPPTVTINQDIAQADPTLTTPITYIADFSEEIVPGTFTPEAVEQTGSASGITWNVTQLSTTKYRVEATSVSVGGTVIPRLKANQITDLAGNYSLVSTSVDASVTYNLIEFYFKSLSLGAEQSCGFANDGKLYCWGNNANYQLGIGPDATPPAGFGTPHLVDYSHLAGVQFRKVDVGVTSTCAIGLNNKLYCWGKGDNYANAQYNWNSTTGYSIKDQHIPAIVNQLVYRTYACSYYGLYDAGSSYVDVSVGSTHICAIDSNYRLTCFGTIPQNGIQYTAPGCIEMGGIPGGKNFKQVSSGAFGSCALNAEGNVYCFGTNDAGQVGDATNTNRSGFVAISTSGISGFDGFSQLSTGTNHSCAVTFGGKVYCWGRGLEGQLGNGSFANRNAPTQIDTSSLGNISFVEVKAGSLHTCARTSKSQIYCWGDASNGKLGNASASSQASPTLVLGPTGTFENLVSLELGDNHSCALAANGKMHCWGAQGTEGRLGNNSIADANRPAVVDVTGLLSKRALVSVSAGLDNTCAVGSDSKVYCWGAGSTGKLGDGISDRLIPWPINTALVGGAQFVQVSTGRGHSCGLTAAGKAYCWGQNNEGQLGDGTTNASVTPVEVNVNVVGLDDPATPDNEFLGFKSISVGYSHTCALHADGKAFCWGYGLFGQLGSNSILSQSKPQMVNSSIAGFSTFAQIDTGDHHTCGITSRGKAYCWGWGSLGRNGDNTTTDRLVPTLVNTTLNSDIVGNPQEVFTKISAGSEHTCVMTVGSRAYCWGNGTDGRLGNFDATNSTKLTPATVDMSALGTYVGIASLDAGKEHSCLSLLSGKAACWGTGTKGRVGVGDFLSKSRPVSADFSAITNYSGSSVVTAGGTHSCAIGILGEQYCWGEGLNGRLGNAATDNQGVPVNILFP